MYQIDGTSKVVDIMSDVLAQRVDLEGIDFLKNQFVASGSRYTTEFNVTPIASFSGTPTEWRREIRNVINHLASRMIDDLKSRSFNQ